MQTWLTCRTTLLVALGVVMAGCGDTSSSEGERPPRNDAGTEASTPSSWTVHVVIQRAGGPLPVLTSNPDGTIAALTQTDASGKADVQVPHLGSVSVFLGFDEADGDPEIRRVLTYSIQGRPRRDLRR